MLELTSYKNAMDAINQLSGWLEQAQQGMDLPKEPSQELVAQFQAAMESGQAAPVGLEASIRSAEEPLAVNNAAEAENPERVNKNLFTITDQEEIHLEKGMEALDEVSTHADLTPERFSEVLKILAKKAEHLSPTDLLQVQRYMGMASFSTESGKKASEGVSETFETILDMEG